MLSCRAVPEKVLSALAFTHCKYGPVQRLFIGRISALFAMTAGLIRKPLEFAEGAQDLVPLTKSHACFWVCDVAAVTFGGPGAVVLRVLPLDHGVDA